MIRRLVVLLIVVLSACDTQTAAEQHPLADVPAITSISESGLPSAEATNDLAALIGHARIVGLGESRHDTREQFEYRADVTRTLVRDLDFRVLILEESFSHAMALDAYVTTGQGDLRAILNDLAGWYLWDTEEMLAFIEWARRFNTTVAPADRLRIQGMDITAPALGLRRAVATAERLDENAGWADRDYGLDLQAGDFWPQVLRRYSDLPANRANRIGSNLEALAAYLEAAVGDASTDVGLQIAAVEAHIAANGHRMFAAQGMAAIGEAREQGMAEVVDWIVSRDGAATKAIIWTHNLHAAKARFRMPGLAEGYLAPLGTLLAETYGTQYLAVGASFGTGEFPGDVPPGPRSFATLSDASIDGALAQLGHASVLLDISGLDAASRAAAWLAPEREWRMQDSSAYLSAADAFDAIYFVDRVSRANLTPAAVGRYRSMAETR